MQFYSEVDGHGSVGQEVTVTVEQGASVSEIATVLKDNGVIQYDWLFKLYTKYSGRAGGLQYGDFQVHAGMSYNDIITTLSEQKVFRETVRVTIPEGTTAVGVAQIFVDQGLVDSVETFLNCAEGKDVPISVSMNSGTRSRTMRAVCSSAKAISSRTRMNSIPMPVCMTSWTGCTVNSTPRPPALWPPLRKRGRPWTKW